MEDKQIVIERTFSAPRQKVWDAWVEADQVAAWWGPEGFSTRVEASDLREGGKWRYVMIDDASGKEYPSEGVITELVELEKIVTTDEFGEEMAANPNLPHGVVTTVLFEEVEGGTKLTVQIDHPTLEDKEKHAKMGVVEGWGSSLNKLEELVQA